MGAGPAGSMAAHALSQRGLAVLLVDRAARPRWKVCGCCLNPCTLDLLAKAGLGDLAGQWCAVPLRQMHLAAGRSRAHVPLTGWQALSRTRLDFALVELAIACGTHFLPETQVTLGPECADRRIANLRRGNERVEIAARLIVAADGLGSRLLQGEDRGAIRIAPGSRVGAGAVAEFAPAFYELGIIYMAYGAGGYVGLVRLEDGRLNLAAALDVDFLKKSQNPGRATAQLLHETGWPPVNSLAELPWQGTPALTRQAARPACARVFAIGDAGGYVEPFTGEGIGWALASGLSVVPLALRAVYNWEPSLADEWTALARQSKNRSRRMCRAIAWVSRRPLLSRSLVGLVGRLPWLAGPVVNRIGKGAVPSFERLAFGL